MDIENIDKFIVSLQDYEKKFEFLDYDGKQYNCEISLLQTYEQQYNHQALLAFWNEKLSQDCFELQHPLLNDIKTRAVCNITDDYDANFVFFVDKENKYPWVLVQNFFLADFFVVEGFYFRIRSTYTNHYKLPIARILDKKDLFWYRKVEYGFVLNKLFAPQHFFIHSLNPYLALKDNNKPIYDTPIFFTTKKMQSLKTKSQELVYFFPNMATGFVENFKIVYQDALESYPALRDEDTMEYELKIWLGIPKTPYRTYIEKYEAFVLLIQNLNKHFSKIKIYVDGLTSLDGLGNQKNDDFFDTLVNLCQNLIENTFVDKVPKVAQTNTSNPMVALKSLNNYDYRTKICYCYDCDIAISEGNTTALVPFDICAKPGVCFIPFTSWSRKFICCKMVDSSFIRATFDTKHRGEGCRDYHLPPEHLYNLAAESLEELSLEGKIKGYSKDKPLKMHRLPVPPVELYAKLYELEKKTKVALKGNKAELEILGKIESQRKLLEAQNLLLDSANRSETPSTPKPQGAKERIHNHLAYKLGLALIVCSKSLWGYIRMPYVLSHIKAQHRFEQEKYQRAITRNPNLKLPKLESYADYQDALKEKQCYTYKLGLALMEADKTWLKGGYLWFYLESKRLKREFEKERR